MGDTGAPRPAPARFEVLMRRGSERREKLRMRIRALHELRRFLPPSVAPAGQSLTKIETLRLAIRYIGHLSAVLGLGDDGLQRRRPPPGCPLCPDGSSAQAQTFMQAHTLTQAQTRTQMLTQAQALTQAHMCSPSLGVPAGASWEAHPAGPDP
ncbi:mesoderm posterior protein 1 [Erinaceus europaeus]|uniref:Mesoderm posterior protein 1 n=1 Tax=Erinaceus europaeus TaxID=9365 RepID=A0ABM3WGC2_ERIEU|nr:mesoderm posterior protein 1 [Erinaceus europaeus]